VRVGVDTVKLINDEVLGGRGVDLALMMGDSELGLMIVGEKVGPMVVGTVLLFMGAAGHFALIVVSEKPTLVVASA
jgi:hypothetical protein